MDTVQAEALRIACGATRGTSTAAIQVDTWRTPTPVKTPAVEQCADELVVGGGVGWFMSGGGGVGGVRPDERALKQRTRWTGVFFWFYRGQPLHL